MDTIDLPTSLSEAKQLGVKRYFTGKPCPKGHVTHRYVAGGNCAACVSIRAKAKYDSGWRQDTAGRPEVNSRWNGSTKGAVAKQRWREKNPKRAWAVHNINAAKRRALAKGVPFTITAEYLASIIPDACPVFSTPFVFINGKVMRDTSPTVDRLRPELGYVEGNVAVISLKANSIKNAYGSEDLDKVAKWLREKGL